MLKTERDRLVVENLPLVGYLVSEIWARATHLSRDDLASAASLGLVLAAESFDPDRGATPLCPAKRASTGPDQSRMTRRCSRHAPSGSRRSSSSYQPIT